MLYYETKQYSDIFTLLFIAYFIQTLTTLNLHRNNLCSEGAQHIVYAIQENKVTFLPDHPIIQPLFYIDTHYIRPRKQFYRFTRNTTFGQCSAKKRSNIPIFLPYHSLLILCRHSPHLTSTLIILVPKERSILLMQYSETK